MKMPLLLGVNRLCSCLLGLTLTKTYVPLKRRKTAEPRLTIPPWGKPVPLTPGVAQTVAAMASF